MAQLTLGLMRFGRGKKLFIPKDPLVKIFVEKIDVLRFRNENFGVASEEFKYPGRAGFAWPDKNEIRTHRAQFADSGSMTTFCEYGANAMTISMVIFFLPNDLPRRFKILHNPNGEAILASHGEE